MRFLIVPLILLFFGCDIIDRQQYQFTEDQSKALSMFFSVDIMNEISMHIEVDKSINSNGLYLPNKNLIKLKIDDAITLLHESVHWYQFNVLGRKIDGHDYNFDYSYLSNRLNVEQEAVLVTSYYESLQYPVYMSQFVKNDGKWINISENRKPLLDYMARYMKLPM